jgi:uncharacterized membrane protein YczE
MPFVKMAQNRVWMVMIHWDSIENNQESQWLSFILIEIVLAIPIVFSSYSVGNKWLSLLGALYFVLVSFLIDATTFHILQEPEYYYLWSFQMVVGSALILQSIIFTRAKFKTSEFERL